MRVIRESISRKKLDLDIDVHVSINFEMNRTMMMMITRTMSTRAQLYDDATYTHTRMGSSLLPFDPVIETQELDSLHAHIDASQILMLLLSWLR